MGHFLIPKARALSAIEDRAVSRIVRGHKPGFSQTMTQRKKESCLRNKSFSHAYLHFKDNDTHDGTSARQFQIRQMYCNSCYSCTHEKVRNMEPPYSLVQLFSYSVIILLQTAIHHHPIQIERVYLASSGYRSSFKLTPSSSRRGFSSSRY